ncbi:MAG: DNA helicase II, partial [Gammaproteobacteria bacterium]
KQQLYLTYAQSRRLHGKETCPGPSRFIHEIPVELIEEVRMRAAVSRTGGEYWDRKPSADRITPTRQEIEPVPGLRLGQQVVHAKFGEGVILNYEGRGDQARVQINFRRAGSKWLMVSYANLQPA